MRSTRLLVPRARFDSDSAQEIRDSRLYRACRTFPEPAHLRGTLLAPDARKIAPAAEAQAYFGSCREMYGARLGSLVRLTSASSAISADSSSPAMPHSLVCRLAKTALIAPAGNPPPSVAHHTNKSAASIE